MWSRRKSFLQSLDELQVEERNADTRQPKIRSVRHKEIKALKVANVADVGFEGTIGEHVIEQYRILSSFHASFVYVDLCKLCFRFFLGYYVSDFMQVLFTQALFILIYASYVSETIKVMFQLCSS